jgi:GABA(A) receptor-associated protein
MQAAPFESRRAESARILSKYPDRIPVLCDRSPRSLLPEIPKKKFLVPPGMLCGEFKYIIHKHISQMAGLSMGSEQTIYLFINSTTTPKSGSLMSEIYATYKSEDGFLYMTYSAENTLG